MRTQLLSAIALVALSPSLARAANGFSWARVSGGPPESVYLLCLDSPDGANLFTAGMTMTASGMIPTISPHVYASSNRGVSYTEITGNLANEKLTSVTGISFIDAQTGFVTTGKAVWSTTDRGATWTKHPVDATINAIKFFDAQRGVAVGKSGAIRLTSDGGATWRSVSSGTTASLHTMFWLDDKLGWINAYDNTDSLPSCTSLCNGAVLYTTDGGETWSSSPLADRGMTDVFFLSDGQTGFLAAYDLVGSETNNAHLYKSTDGGKTWTDMKVDVKVGQLSSPFGAMSLPASFFHTMYWSDAQNGHLGGSAYIGTTSDSQTGGNRKIYRVVDFLTHDGGATWQKTNLGNVSMMGGPDDGQLTAGRMRTLYGGWMVGTFKSTWSYFVPCQVAADCGPGATCNDRICEPTEACMPVCGDGKVCSVHRCVDGSSVNPGADGGSSSGDPSNGGNGSGEGGTQAAGCSCASAGGGVFAGVWLLGLLVLPRIGWRRRKS